MKEKRTARDIVYSAGSCMPKCIFDNIKWKAVLDILFVEMSGAFDRE